MSRSGQVWEIGMLTWDPGCVAVYLVVSELGPGAERPFDVAEKWWQAVLLAGPPEVGGLEGMVVSINEGWFGLPEVRRIA